VDRDGLLVELVDVHEWAAPYTGLPLPVPTIERYAAHSRATLCGGHACLVLTPNGEIKIFADGRQVFSFLDGRWRLTDAREKYDVWRRALANAPAAERLFTVALSLADDRRGALFVVLDESTTAEDLVAPGDLLTEPTRTPAAGGKQQLHYLLRDVDLFRIAPAVLESIARIDGAIVADPSGRLLAFGAILRPPKAADPALIATEGGRTTAALSASRFGKVLMVSEDGRVSFFHIAQPTADCRLASCGEAAPRVGGAMNSGPTGSVTDRRTSASMACFASASSDHPTTSSSGASCSGLRAPQSATCTPGSSSTQRTASARTLRAYHWRARRSRVATALRYCA
jgi:hypothetical protein